jgi:hypothetical protein
VPHAAIARILYTLKSSLLGLINRSQFSQAQWWRQIAS